MSLVSCRWFSSIKKQLKSILAYSLFRGLNSTSHAFASSGRLPNTHKILNSASFSLAAIKISKLVLCIDIQIAFP